MISRQPDPAPRADREGVPPAALAALTAARESAIALLTDRFADETLTVEEFEARLEQLYAARTSAELEVVMRGLAEAPTGVPVPPALARYSPAAGQATVPQSHLSAILASAKRVGRWLVPPFLEVQVVLGDAMIDLRDAMLPSGDCVIDVFAVLGDVKLLVPPGVVVNDTMSSVMGSVHNDAIDDGRMAPGGMQVRLTGTALLSEIGIRVALPGDPATSAWKRAKWGGDRRSAISRWWASRRGVGR
jgi:hypothetical protein